MKILQVLPNLGSGGAEHFVVELSKELTRKGHLCHVVSLYEIPERNILNIDLIESSITTFSLNKKRGLDCRTFFRLLNLIQRGRYDVVHAHVGAIKYILLSSLFYKKAMYVATIHSEARREAGRSVDKWTRRYMFGRKLCVPVTISEESEKSFEKFYGHKTFTIMNGVSEYKKKLTCISIREKDTQIVFVHPASCQPIKNQRLLFLSFARLVKKYPRAKLIWLGNTETFADLFNELKSIMVPQIEVLGVVPNIRDYLVQADAMCLSSHMEGMPMSIIESFSVGCPAICTPVGGCLNIIRDRINGLLSKDMQVDSYYNALLEFCSLTESERMKMKKNAKNDYSLYSINDCAEKYINLYNNYK